MQIGVIGINHKLADLKLREKLAKACQRRFGAEYYLHYKHAFVLLSTCNRTEIYFSSENLAETHSYILSILKHHVEEEFDQKLYSYFNNDCFLHLARVASGLDSAIIAETEIQGQVKNAYQKACEFTHLPHELHYLFQKCLKIGKNVRSELPKVVGIPDLEHAILSAGKSLCGSPDEKRLLFVGVSDINLKILSFLKENRINNITLCNRTDETAFILSRKYDIGVLEWSELGRWHEYDWIIFGTKAPEYLITQKGLPKGLLERKLIIDLCVPRNVDPSLGYHSKITLLNIDQINRMLKVREETMSNFLVDAEAFIDKHTERQVSLFKEKERRLCEQLV